MFFKKKCKNIPKERITEELHQLYNAVEQRRDVIEKEENALEYLEKDIDKKENEILAQIHAEIADESIREFIEKNEGYKFVGLTDSQNGRPYVKCKKCDVYFNLFEIGTGIGIVFDAQCPKCKIEIDLTNFDEW